MIRAAELMQAAAVLDQVSVGFAAMADQHREALAFSLHAQAVRQVLLQLAGQAAAGGDPFDGMMDALAGGATGLPPEKLTLLRLLAAAGK